MTDPIIERRVASSPCESIGSNDVIPCGGEVEVRVSGGWACTRCHVLREPSVCPNGYSCPDADGNCHCEETRKRLDEPATASKVEPAHYGGADNPYEAIKVIEHLGWGPGFCKGNALKYLMRAGKKSGESEADDLAKARWCIDRAIAGLEK